MANLANNPLSKLFDIEFPDIKRSNWNCSHDISLTADVGYVKPVFVDRILPNTRVKLDINTASFANATIAPLYGRYRVKYLAFWAPDRLYMGDWQDGGAVMPGDDFFYPLLPMPILNSYGISVAPTLSTEPDRLGLIAPESVGDFTISRWTTFPYTGISSPYVPPTSLIEYLGAYAAYTQTADWYDPVSSVAGVSDTYKVGIPRASNAFSFLAFWDIYRNFILNVQEENFYIRTRGFKPEVEAKVYDQESDQWVDFTYQAQFPADAAVPRESLDGFFRRVKRWNTQGGNCNVTQFWEESVGIPILPQKDVVPRANFNGIGSPSLNDFDNYILRDEFHYLLPFAPYQPDMFSSWISNENVELEQSKSTVYVENNKFTMEQWKVASRIQNMMRKSLFKNSDFAEYIDVQYGVRPSTGITKPMFLGAFVSDIIFQDVVSSAQTGSGSDLQNNDALGSRAGYGVGRDTDKENFVDFTSKEPGTFMILQIIMPEVFYFEGRDLMYDKQNFAEEFNPEYDAIGYQDLHLSQMNICPNLSKDPFGRAKWNSDFESYDRAVAQQPYAMEHMVKYNQLKGMMVMPNYYQKWTLARSFNYNRGNLSADFLPGRTLLSTYPFPEMYNNIFQNEQGVDNFQFYLSLDYLKYQPIGKQFLSFN